VTLAADLLLTKAHEYELKSLAAEDAASVDLQQAYVSIAFSAVSIALSEVARALQGLGDAGTIPIDDRDEEG